MTTIDMKENVLTAINKADHRLLRFINALIESYNEDEEEEIVAYTVSGAPLTKEQYRQRVMDVRAEIEKGNYITHEDLKKKVRSWGK